MRMSSVAFLLGRSRRPVSDLRSSTLRDDTVPPGQEAQQWPTRPFRGDGRQAATSRHTAILLHPGRHHVAPLRMRLSAPSSIAQGNR